MEQELYWLLLVTQMQALSMTMGEVCDKCIFSFDGNSNQISPPFYRERFSHPEVLCYQNLLPAASSSPTSQ